MATATVCAMLGLECVVYMGEEDIRRQALNVFRMRLLGAEVRSGGHGQPHAQGCDQRGDARLGDERRHDALPARFGGGSAPLPDDRARLPIGDRPRDTASDRGGKRAAAGSAWSRAWAGEATRSACSCRSSGTRRCSSWASRPVGLGLPSGRHAASLSAGAVGVLHGARTLLLQDADGQVLETHSVSAGLDYPGVGPEHAYLQEIG